MEPKFGLDCRRSVGNLHISLRGEFNGNCAWALVKAIKVQYPRAGRIFVNTNRLEGVTSEGVRLFKSHMNRKKIPRDWLYFKGERGFEIAPDGGRVLVSRKPCPGRKSCLKARLTR